MSEKLKAKILTEDMEDVKKAELGDIRVGSPGERLDELKKEFEVPPYSNEQAINEIRDMISSIEEAKLNGGVLAIGKLKGAIEKLRDGLKEV